MSRYSVALTEAELRELGLIDSGTEYVSHRWNISGYNRRRCIHCGTTEYMWNDLEQPVKSCMDTSRRNPSWEKLVRPGVLEAYREYKNRTGDL